MNTASGRRRKGKEIPQPIKKGLRFRGKEPGEENDLDNVLRNSSTEEEWRGKRAKGRQIRLLGDHCSNRTGLTLQLVRAGRRGKKKTPIQRGMGQKDPKFFPRMTEGKKNNLIKKE